MSAQAKKFEIFEKSSLWVSVVRKFDNGLFNKRFTAFYLIYRKQPNPSQNLMSHFCLLVTLFFNMKFQDFCQRNSEYPSKLLLKKDKVWPLQSIQQPWPTYPGPGFGQCYSSLCCSFWDWTQSLLYQKQHLRLFMMGIPNSEITR